MENASYIVMNPFPDFVTPVLSRVMYVLFNPVSVLHGITQSAPFFFFQAVLVLALIVFFVGTVYVIKKTNEIHRVQNKKINAAFAKRETVKSGRWGIVVKHLNSENSGEWRLAIIEADSLLEETLRKMGYRGETFGDVLKKIDRSALVTINEAWEAHKVRNMIAHKGSSFVFSKNEARRVIALYERVFRELEII